MFGKIALGADNLAAAAQTAPATHGIDIHTQAAGRVENRRAMRKYATPPRRRKHDFRFTSEILHHAVEGVTDRFIGLLATKSDT